ncbi:MAG: PASTA domain-containing protein [Gemmatimonadaceae bacterium]
MSTTGSLRTGILAACVIVSLAGCRSATPEFARLESAVVRDQYAGSPQAANVRVVRGESVIAPSISMRLQKGDSIITSPTSRVVVTFAAGYEVTLDTSTAIYIENPSIFLRIGKAFIRKLRGAPDTLTTRTPQAVLHDAGTEFLVSVTTSETSVQVIEGAVEAESHDGSYPPIRYHALEQGVIGSRGPQRMPDLTREELTAQLEWVRQVQRITRILVPQLDSMTEAQARATLERAGLRVLFVTRREAAGYAPGVVVAHTPSAGDSVAPGTFINLVLAREPQPARVDCTVPAIVDKTEAEARRLLEAAQLTGRATERIGEIDVVTSQAEEAGSKVPCGSVVRYTWGRIG